MSNENLHLLQDKYVELEQAVDVAISEMPDDSLIKKFLIANKAEVKGMFLTEWDQEKVLAQERKETENVVREGVATDMLKENLPIPLIAKISKLSEDAVIRLANTLGVTIV